MTETPTHLTEAPALLDAVERVRLQAAYFFRSAFTDAFAVWSVASSVIPDAVRPVVFHIVARGSCWVRVEGGEPIFAEAGDVIVAPYGERHLLTGRSPAEEVEIDTVMQPPPWATLPVVHHGGGGDPTDLVCGFLSSEDLLFDPSLRAFPRVFVARPAAGPLAAWVQASIDLALAEGERGPVSTRLPELVVTEVLRAHLATAAPTDDGWLAALADPVVAPALARLHADPARRWTVASLASEVAASRSLLDERFRRLLGRPPIRYLTEWRMQLAEDLLATTDLGVAAVARRVGYDAEESFSRAFKRERGVAPSVRRVTSRP